MNRGYRDGKALTEFFNTPDQAWQEEIKAYPSMQDNAAEKADFFKGFNEVDQTWRTVEVSGYAEHEGGRLLIAYARYVHYPNFIKLLLCTIKSALLMQMEAFREYNGVRLWCKVKVTKGKK